MKIVQLHTMLSYRWLETNHCLHSATFHISERKQSTMCCENRFPGCLLKDFNAFTAVKYRTKFFFS